ncbi:hypothetical protein M758_12G048500 [Ceratodon purpureus]|uniref:sterol 14alpha-demethylase n=1 Tax=Ceratodon purpureus TaxID=3225 RepID=A0A8T0G7N3_CERPU|nr:hypothetical protein KC19_12G045900 [Ceratodon purpureus]KAG0598132.1 hypothetical protein M758_12G048500 [Ceratodon purpureus]
MEGASGTSGTSGMEAVVAGGVEDRSRAMLLMGSLAVAVVVGWLLLGWSRRGRSLPPVVSCVVPFVGGLLKFVKGPIPLLREQYQVLGSVFTVKILTRNITFLLGPEVSAHFYKAQEADLSQREVYQFNVPTFGPGVVFDVDYSVRMEQFRFFTEALTVKRLKSYVTMMVEEAEMFFSKWEDEGEVDLKEQLEQLIVNTASRCLLGQEIRNSHLEKVTSLFHDLDNGMLPISVMFPYLPIPAHNRRDRARKEIAELFANVIKARKASGKTEPDMLQAFMDSKYRSLGRGTTEEECTGLLIAALFAGQHTSSITSTWTGAYLMKHKEFMPAVIEEQKEIIRRHGSHVDYDVLSEMTSLHRAMKEALRLHPPLILLLRQNHSDFNVTTREGKTFTIPKGHIVGTSPAFSNRLPYVYKDPDTYNPDRFAPGNEEDVKAGQFSYTSFGGGRHGCLGETFAYMQVKTVWSYLLQHFELELTSPFPEVDWNAMVVGIKGKVMVRYKRRQLTCE